MLQATPVDMQQGPSKMEAHPTAGSSQPASSTVVQASPTGTVRGPISGHPPLPQPSPAKLVMQEPQPHMSSPAAASPANPMHVHSLQGPSVSPSAHSRPRRKATRSMSVEPGLSPRPPAFVSPDAARVTPSVTSNTATAAPSVVSTAKSSAAPATDQIKQQLGDQCWVSKIDKKSGKRYYFTAAEKRPQWEAPAGWEAQQTAKSVSSTPAKMPDDVRSTTKSAGGSTTSAPKSGDDSTTTKSGAGSTTAVPKSAKNGGDSTTAETKSGGDGTTAATMTKSGGGSTATSNTSNQSGGGNTAATDESAKASLTKKVPMSSPHGSAPVSSPTTKPPRPSAKKPGTGS